MTQSRTESPVFVTGFPWCAKAITKSDSTDLTGNDGKPTAMSIYVGGAGTVRVQPLGNADGTTVDFTVAAGGYVPVLVTRVYSSGTSATLMVGLF